jgi:hypothetical protein
LVRRQLEVSSGGYRRGQPGNDRPFWLRVCAALAPCTVPAGLRVDLQEATSGYGARRECGL